MAHDRDDLDDLFDDEDFDAGDEDTGDEDFSDDEDFAEEDFDAEPEDAADLDSEQHVRECIALLETEGISMPDTVDADHFVEHLCTAIKTKQATKAMQDAEGDEEEFMATDDAAVEETPALLSGVRLKNFLSEDPVRVELYQSKVKRRRKWRASVIDRAARSGLMPPARIKELRASAGRVCLSLNRHNFKLPKEEIDILLEGIDSVVRGEGGRSQMLSTLTGSKAVDIPAEDELDKQRKELAGKLGGSEAI